jgi:acetyl-CoA carboxylase biotin carboxylase subunit
VDLVKEQIRSAAGERIEGPASFSGHSIECRINAEDPEHDFRPSPGRITAFHAPGGPGIRIDTHVYAGYSVPQYYDSLLGKLIAHGRTREEALGRAYQALEEFIIEGVKTTIPFLREVLRHPDFVAGNFDTHFLERMREAG